MVYAGAIAVIDPFNLLPSTVLVPVASKMKAFNCDAALKPFGHALWKMNEFRRRPCPQVVFGDSRANDFDYAHMSRLAGSRVFNFGIPGGDYHSLTDTFFFAASQTRLERVVVCISPHTCQDSINRHLCEAPRAVLRNPLRYFTDKRVRVTAWYALLDRLGRLEKTRGRDAWERVLAGVEQEAYRNWSEPQAAREACAGIGRFCASNRIELIWVVHPTCAEHQALLVSNGVASAWADFCQSLARYGTVYDFDRPGAIAADRSNFIDPLHVKAEIGRSVVEDLWGSSQRLARVIAPLQAHAAACSSPVKK